MDISVVGHVVLECIEIDCENIGKRSEAAKLLFQ